MYQNQRCPLLFIHPLIWLTFHFYSLLQVCTYIIYVCNMYVCIYICVYNSIYFSQSVAICVMIFVICNWLCQNPLHAHTMAKNGFHHQSIVPYHNTTVKSWIACFLRLVSETCQMSTSALVPFECHWLACTDSHLAENHHITCWWCRPWV